MDSLDLIANLVGPSIPLLLLLLWFKGIPWGPLVSPPTRFLNTVLVGSLIVLFGSVALQMLATMGAISLQMTLPVRNALTTIPFVGSFTAIYLLVVNPSQKQRPPTTHA